MVTVLQKAPFAPGFATLTLSLAAMSGIGLIRVKPKEEWVIVPDAFPAIISYQQADGI